MLNMLIIDLVIFTLLLRSELDVYKKVNLRINFIFVDAFQAKCDFQ